MSLSDPLPLTVVVLTVLAAVVVLLTRVRLSGDAGAGRYRVGGGALAMHTICGVLALLLWVPYVFAGDGSALGGALVGIVALAFWWLTALAGLLILMRWLPTRGRHASEGTTDSWSRGPWLSMLAHLGMVVGVVVFTVAYLTSAV